MFKKRFLLALVFASMSGLSFGKSSSFNSLPKTNVSTASTAAALANPNQGLGLFENPYTFFAGSFFECTGGGSETFSNLGTASTTYATRTWTGDNGVAWSATDARTDQDLTGDAIALRTSTLKNTSTIANGIGTLSFKYKRVFTGNSTLKVFVNGVQYGGDIAVTSDVAATTFSQAINVSGNVVIEIRNSGNRTIVDDISWNCYSAVAGPELQLADASGTNRECGSLAVDFGSHAVGQYNDAVFTVKNLGTTALNVTAMTLSNTTDFTIISPSVPFTVAPAGSGLVLVRFQGAAAGTKTSTLTIVSNDTDEASCVVNLAGIALQPCAAPVVTAAEVTVSNIAYSSADVAVANATADKYLAVLSTSSTLSASPVNATGYNVGDSLGGGTVAYNGTATNFSLTGLTESTPYYVFVFPYNNNCTGGPVYYTETSINKTFSTPAAPCIGGSETFSNLGTGSTTYVSRTWTGDNGVAWSATDSRNDQDLTGDAIALRTGILKNTTPVAGGIGTLNFNYKRVFTGDSVLKVFVNGTQYGGDITVSADTTTAFSQAINISGPITIEIRNSGNRTIIDDLSWNCYTVPTGPEIQLSDSELVLKECGAFTIDFGAVQTSTDKTIIFTIENLGTQDLEVSALTLSDAVNYSIVNPSVPFTLVPSSAIEVEVKFNSATLGNKLGTLTVVSNDANEGSCVVNLKASAQENCVAPVGTAVIASSNITDTTASVAVSGVTATGYLAIISTTGTVTAPVNGTAYQVNDMLGAGKVVYVGTNANFALSGLTANTNYSITVYAYNAECIGGPLYTATPSNDEILTTGAPCVGGTETFSNLGSSTSTYTTRTWTGNNGITWSATDARTDQDLTGDAIALRVGTLTNTAPITTGIGTLSFNFQRVFTGDSVLKVFVNGTQYGADIAVTSTATTVYSQAINVSGNATIEIRNSGNRVIIDDVAWTCNTSSPRTAAPAKKGNAVLDNSEIKLYPNPSNGQFKLDFAGENADINVFDSLGKNILSKKVASQEVIDLGTAQKGIYIIVIKSGSTTATKKIAIK